MPAPTMSAHFAGRKPSVIRAAQIEYLKRTDGTRDLNVAIGNVSLPMHPVMQERMRTLGEPGSPFAEGVVQYSLTKGERWANDAFLNIIASSGFDTAGLFSQVTDGGSQAMELCVVGLCGPAGTDERPLMLIDAAYTNYTAFAARLGRRTVSITRTLGKDGRFSLPAMDEIRAKVEATRPGALVVIPYDNPTGQLYERAALVELAKLCVEFDMWLLSDEAYRELHYVGDRAISVWGITEDEVPGITGRRISIETASKVWNACGLRIGALVTDNAEFHARAVAENTAGLCSNIIGQWIFGGLAGESHADLQAWYHRQREYYRAMLTDFTRRLHDLLPGVIISRPDASLYSVVDVRDVAPADFDALEFVLWCAREGALEIGGERLTLLTAPMAGFYSTQPGEPNPGRTQMRVAYVQSPERMRLVPDLFAGLLAQYLAQKE
jgi:aspartate aminotransferase